MAEISSSVTVIEAINRRRSVRNFSPEPLARETIQTLLEAAVRAPTAMHQEPWAFAVVQEPARLKRLSEMARALFVEEVYRRHLDRGGHALDAFENPDFNIFYDAGTLIVICAPSVAPFAEADCWLAAENLMLAAYALGLGTCVIGSAVVGLNDPNVKQELGIAEGLSAVVPIVVGVPRESGAATHRKPPRLLGWY